MLLHFRSRSNSGSRSGSSQRSGSNASRQSGSRSGGSRRSGSNESQGSNRSVSQSGSKHSSRSGSARSSPKSGRYMALLFWLFWEKTNFKKLGQDQDLPRKDNQLENLVLRLRKRKGLEKIFDFFYSK